MSSLVDSMVTGTTAVEQYILSIKLFKLSKPSQAGIQMAFHSHGSAILIAPWSFFLVKFSIISCIF